MTNPIFRRRGDESDLIFMIDQFRRDRARHRLRRFLRELLTLVLVAVLTVCTTVVIWALVAPH